MSSECDKYSIELSAYFDGELDDEEIISLESHLADCPECKVELAKMEKLHNVIVEASSKTVKSRPLFQEIMDRLESEEKLANDKGLVS